MMEQTQKNQTRSESVPDISPSSASESVTDISPSSASQKKEREQLAEPQKKEAEREQLAEQQKREAERERLAEPLFGNAMNDQWQEVVEVFKNNSESHYAKITGAKDTALHLAVSGGKLEFVLKLVETLGEKPSDVLQAKNIKGNTPLHIAAALGNAWMCHSMASKDWKLIDIRNNKNETPLYLAALYGHKDAFLCLYYCYKGNQSDVCSRDEKGNSILHAAIDGEHYDLAFQILSKYAKSDIENLVNAVNEDGLTPLHILATKTNSFKSSSRLGLLDRIIYNGIRVNEAKDETHHINDYQKRFDDNGSVNSCFPQNYETCVHSFQMFVPVICYGMPSLLGKCSWGWRRFLSYVNCKKKHSKGLIDEENQTTNKVTQGGYSVSQTKIESNNVDADAKGSSHTSIGSSTKVPEEDGKVGHFPANYETFIKFFQFLMKLIMVVLGLGFHRIKKIETKKQRYTWASQVMNKLIENYAMYKYSSRGQAGGFDRRMTGDIPFDPSQMDSSSLQGSSTDISRTSPAETSDENKHQGETDSKEEEKAAAIEKLLQDYRITGTVDPKTSKHAVTMKFEKKVSTESTKSKTPLLIAASKGITEMVEKILEKFPVSIQDLDDDDKNVMLLAVENRQTHTFQFLIERKRNIHESVFLRRDYQGNNALHLAATFGHHRPWIIPGSALQMQWELKWYKFVKETMAKHLLSHYNNAGQTPKQIFTETHRGLVKDASEWLNKTSESCSLVAALIATVAFATSSSIPGGVNENTGEPVLRNEPAFDVFAISALVALCFSITALVFFLAILTSRFEEKDFANKLPRRLILGLTSLFASIAAMLISFCAGHFFELRDKLRFAAFPIYAVTCLPISFFALAQLPLYFDLLRAILQNVPRRGYKEPGS